VPRAVLVLSFRHTDEIRKWASMLAGEAREPAWIRDFYICPHEIRNLAYQVDSITRGLVCLVGAQGVGKSSALKALYMGLPGTTCPMTDKVLFKWRSDPGLYETFLDCLLGFTLLWCR